VKITHTWLESRKEPRRRPATRQDVNVDGREGLVVRLHPSGAISFRFRFTGWNPKTNASSRRWLVFGEYGNDGLSLAKAFELHALAQSELEQGLDPIEERAKRQETTRRAREERAGSGSVADLVEQFVHRKLRAERWDEKSNKWVRDEKNKTRARKRPDAAAALLGYVGPTVKRKRKVGKATLISTHGRLNARDLTKRQLIALLDGIVDRGAPITANRTYALLNQLFDWAAAKDLVLASPMAGVERPGGNESPRNRTLSVQEIKAVWAKLDTADMAMATHIALKLLLVTGQRRGELTFALWSHFDMDDAKLWTIPPDLLKSSHARRGNPEPHQVPLSPLAIKLLRELKMISGDGAYVLPAHGRKKNDRPYSAGSLSRAVFSNRKHFGVAAFTPHDLRRTAASFMTKIGIPRLHVEKVLNHSTGDIAEVYDRHDYLPEKRVALERWASHLQSVIDGKENTVVPLSRSA
jgi:integrase